jgi:hypothetical protein
MLQRNAGQPNNEADGRVSDDLAVRLSQMPRPVMPADVEARVRSHVHSALAAPVGLRRLTSGGAVASGGLLGSLPPIAQILFVGVLLSLAGWLIFRDVSAYASPPAFLRSSAETTDVVPLESCGKGGALLPSASEEGSHSASPTPSVTGSHAPPSPKIWHGRKRAL